MPAPDSTARAALAAPAHAPAYFIWIDVVGDPIRLTTFGKDVAFSGTADADLNGNTFLSFDHRAIEVGDVTQSDSGSDTLSVTLSGIENIVDSGLMAEIEDTTKWRARTVRLWMQVYDESGTTAQGAIVPYYTGYASAVTVRPSAESQAAELSVENYLAAFSQASNRNYLNQSDYDATDTSAAATIAAANMSRFGSSGSAGVNGYGTGGGSGGGGGGGGGGGMRPVYN